MTPRPFILDLRYAGALEPDAIRRRFLSQQQIPLSMHVLFFAAALLVFFAPAIIPLVIGLASGWSENLVISFCAGLFFGLFMNAGVVVGIFMVRRERAGLHRLAWESELVTGEIVSCQRR